MITTANIDLGTRFGGSVDAPFEITHCIDRLARTERNSPCYGCLYYR